VSQVFFVVNIYTPHRTFGQVASPFCRIIDDASGAELCRYSLKDAGRENGLIIAKILRDASGRWGFHALGLPCRGRTYKDSLPQIRAACTVKTSSLMLRTQRSFDLSEVDSVPPVELALPPAFVDSSAGNKCCVLM